MYYRYRMPVGKRQYRDLFNRAGGEDVGESAVVNHFSTTHVDPVMGIAEAGSNEVRSHENIAKAIALPKGAIHGVIQGCSKGEPGSAVARRPGHLHGG